MTATGPRAVPPDAFRAQPDGTARAWPTGPGARTGPGAPPATDPYPWPYDGELDPGRLALVVAGCQPARWRTGDPARLHQVIGAVAAAAAAVRRGGGRVVHVAHRDPVRLAGASGPRPVGASGHQPAGGGAPAADPGGDRPGPWPGPVPVLPADDEVLAGGVDGFWGSGLDPLLRAAGVTHLALAGFGLEGPVHSTLRSANDRGYECLLLVDACSPLDDATAAAAVSTVTMSGGIFGAVGTTAALAAVLSSHPPPAA